MTEAPDDDWKYDQTFAIGERVSLAEHVSGDDRGESEWEKASVAIGAVGHIQFIGPHGPPQYFVRFACGSLTVRGSYFASQLRPGVAAP